MKHLIAILLTVGMLLSFAAPVLALGPQDDAAPVSQPLDSGEAMIPPQPQQDEGADTIPPQPAADGAPAFSARLIVDEQGYGVEGTLEEIPADAVSITLVCLADGEEYELDEPYNWLPEADGEADAASAPRSQVCIRSWDNYYDNPFCEYLMGALDDFTLKLRITTADGSQYDTNAAAPTREALPPPDEPPAFTAVIEQMLDGYSLTGVFTDFTPDIKTVQPVYALDGEHYQSVAYQNGESFYLDLTKKIDSAYAGSLTRQSCARALMEPLKSYMDGVLDEFHIKLRIDTWSGVTYYTEPARISRGNSMDQPADSKALASWASYMSAKDDRFSPNYGKVQVTAREGMTAAQLLTLLPDTLPIEIQLTKKGSVFPIDTGVFPYSVEWTLPSELVLSASDEPLVIKGAIVPPVISAGQEVAMVNGIYRLTAGAEFDERYCTTEVRLFVNVLPQDQKANIALFQTNFGFVTNPHPLALAFHQKPSGATAIRYFYYREGMEDWEEVGELLSQTPVDAKPGHPASENYLLFMPDETPYRDWVAGEISGFQVGVEIEGGVFDGEKHVLSWPEAYDIPPGMPDFNGSGGNENNVGGGGTGGGDSSGNGGQRPGLPDEDEAPTQPPTGGQDPELSPEPSLRPDPEPLPKPAPQPNPEPLLSPNPAPEPSSKPTPDLEPKPAERAPLPHLPNQNVGPVLALAPEAFTPSAPQSPPQTAAPSASPDPSFAPEASQQPTEEVARTPGESKQFPPVAAVSVVVVGVAATAAIGSAAGAGSAAASGGIVSRVLSVLNRFFLRK